MPHFLEVFQHIVDTNTSGVYIGKIDVTKHGGEHYWMITRFSRKTLCVYNLHWDQDQYHVI